MVNPSDHPPKQQHPLEPLKKLLHKYPFAFWGGVWGVVVFIGMVAIIGIFYPGAIEPEASLPPPTRTTIQQPIEKNAFSAKPTLTTTFAESTPKEGLPLPLFGGLALGCAVGSLLLARVLKQSNQRRQSLKKLKATQKLRKQRRRPSSKPAQIPQTPHPVSPQLTVQTPESQISTTDPQQTQVTVLPVEETIPLDGAEENLAEMLDLRKRQSLASLMRGN